MSNLTHELTIEGVAYGGSGIGRLEGKVVFVPFTIPGERVRVRILRSKKNFAEAELLEVLEPAVQRQTPRCAYFGRCGGCAYQHVDYQTQLEWKTRQVRDLLQRVGHLTDPPVEAALASPMEWGFRNRIRVHSENGRTGFYARHAHRIVDINCCAIAADDVNAELARFRKNPHPPEQMTLSVRRGVNFFEQTNDGAAEVLAGVVEAMIGAGRGLLVDAYAGAGFFGHRLADRFEKVVGIETHEGAVAAARARALAHELYVCGDVGLHLGEILEKADRPRTTVLLDPPAAGVSARVTDWLGVLQVRQVVYVSCDPATLARDVRALVGAGYRLNRVVPVDMFPQTADVEVVVEFLCPAEASSSLCP